MRIKNILDSRLRSKRGTLFVSTEQVEDMAFFLKKIF